MRIFFPLNPLADIPDPCHIAGLQLKISRFQGLFGDHGFDGLPDFIESNVQAVGDQIERFTEAHMAHRLFRDLFPEECRRHSRPDLSLQGMAARSGVDDPLHVHLPDLMTNPGEGERQGVHDKAGIDPGSQDRHPFFPGQLVDPVRHFGIFRCGEEKLLRR